jgi:alpha-1,6-mannosyltransferase
LADGVLALLDRPAAERRAAARARAELFPWSATVAGMLDTHGPSAARRADPRPAAPAR